MLDRSDRMETFREIAGHPRSNGEGSRTGVCTRHNRIRDWAAATYAECTGLPATTEQRVPQWDLIDPDTVRVAEARLDVATSDIGTGAALYLDVVVKCAYSADASVLRRRALRDGCARAMA